MFSKVIRNMYIHCCMIINLNKTSRIHGKTVTKYYAFNLTVSGDMGNLNQKLIHISFIEFIITGGQGLLSNIVTELLDK